MTAPPLQPSGSPTAPIRLAAEPSEIKGRIAAPRVELDDEFLRRLRDACAEVVVDERQIVESSRDWWPLAMVWATEGRVAARAEVIAKPSNADEVAAILGLCTVARVPVTAAAGRSGVCGGSVPLHGGVILDLCGLSGIIDVDDQSLTLDVLPGTFGDWLEDHLRADYDKTLGHWPQSIDLSTVGGWLACRSAGQMSTRYGKIEDMVIGLDVALADGRVVHTGGAPRAAVGPDLNQLFVGSEGTLGVITRAQLRLHPAPPAEWRAAYGFASFADGLDACRRILRRGATPAVIRLYDAIEAQRNFEVNQTLLLLLDEGDELLIEGVKGVVADECGNADVLDVALVERWMGHRNDVSALESLIQKGFVVDTMEIAAPWSACARVYEEATAAIQAVEHTIAVSAHQSHSYTDGACLYFTFGGSPPPDQREAYYRAAWDAGTRAVLTSGGALSHHHGIGLNRARFVREALGDAFDVLVATKLALDPNGVLNPGKLGLPSPFGPPNWP